MLLIYIKIFCFFKKNFNLCHQTIKKYAYGVKETYLDTVHIIGKAFCFISCCLLKLDISKLPVSRGCKRSRRSAWALLILFGNLGSRETSTNE